MTVTPISFSAEALSAFVQAVVIDLAPACDNAAAVAL